MEEEDQKNDLLTDLLRLIGDMDYEETLPMGQYEGAFEGEEAVGDLDAAWQEFEYMMDGMAGHFGKLERAIEASEKFRSLPLNFKKDVGELYLSDKVFSKAALDHLEGYFLACLGGEESYSGGEAELCYVLALYVGEYIVESREGEWMVWDKKSSMCFGKSVVARWKVNDYGTPLDPFALIAKFLQKPEKGMLGKAIRSI